MFRFLGTKIGISMLAALVIVGLAVFAKTKDDAIDSNTVEKVGLIADSSVKSAIDSGELNNDGWEEALRRIQGTSTIDEAIANLTESASTTPEIQKNMTATDRFAQRFFTEYVKLQKNGQEFDEEASVRLANKLLLDDYGGPEGERTFTEADIRVSNGSTVTDIKKYINSLGATLTQPVPVGYENELIIINRVSATEKNEDLEKLALNIARYEESRRNIANMTVPAPLKGTHVALLNSLSAMIEGVKGMKLVTTDPVGATRMVIRYEDGLKSLDLIASQIFAYIQQNRITFTPSETGYIFVE